MTNAKVRREKRRVKVITTAKLMGYTWIDCGATIQVKSNGKSADILCKPESFIAALALLLRREGIEI